MNNEWRDHRSTDRPNFHSKFMRWSSRGASSGRNTSRLPTKKVQRSESEPPRHSNCTVLRLRLNRPVPDRILRFNRSGSGETRSPEENCDSIAIGNSHVRVCTKSRPPPISPSPRNLDSLDPTPRRDSEFLWNLSGDGRGNLTRDDRDRPENSKKCSAVISRVFLVSFFFLLTRPPSVQMISIKIRREEHNCNGDGREIVDVLSDVLTWKKDRQFRSFSVFFFFRKL